MLLSVERGRRADRALDGEGVPTEARPWVHQVVYGVQRFRGRLDHVLSSLLTRPLPELDAPVRSVLRAGLFELLFMDTPSYAAISQSVEMARSQANEGASRLVNAVLRRGVERAGSTAAFPDFGSDPEGYLSTWGSHPRWLIRRWLARWPAAEVRDLVEANNRQPAIALRPADGDMDRLEAALGAEGVTGAERAPDAECLLLPSGARPHEFLVRVGAFVQDPGTALVVRAIEPAEGDWVADLCAAPGGKSLGLRSRGTSVVAGDPSFPRLRLLARRVRELGFEIPLFVGEAQRPPLRQAPVVLLDAPCTGTGTLRRHPDGRWRLRADDVGVMARLQEEILEGGAALVPPGGLLVYATCSLEPEENGEQVQRFLSRHRDFRLEAPASISAALLDGQGCLQVLPQRTGFDGAFAARLRRMP